MRISFLIIAVLTALSLIGAGVYAYAQVAQTPTPAPSAFPLPSLDPSLFPGLQDILNLPTFQGDATSGPFVIPPGLIPTLPSIVPPEAIEARPESPSPNETVTLSVALPTTDRNASSFIWKINGKTLLNLSGPGRFSATVRAGELGSSMTISVNVTKPDGTAVSLSKKLAVSDVAVQWFADNYAPKWYKGKHLPTASSPLVISAIPAMYFNGSLIPPERLIFTWSVDGIPARSGFGQQIFRTAMSDIPAVSSTIHLRVEDAEKRIRKEVWLVPVVYAPRTSVYSVLPLGGIESRKSVTPLATATRGGHDFQVEPFFFPVQTRRELTFSWLFNGVPIQGDPSKPYMLTVDTSGETTARTINIAVSVDDQVMFTNAASKVFSISVQ